MLVLEDFVAWNDTLFHVDNQGTTPVRAEYAAATTKGRIAPDIAIRKGIETIPEKQFIGRPFRSSQKPAETTEAPAQQKDTPDSPPRWNAVNKPSPRNKHLKNPNIPKDATLFLLQGMSAEDMAFFSTENGEERLAETGHLFGNAAALTLNKKKKYTSTPTKDHHITEQTMQEALASDPAEIDLTLAFQHTSAPKMFTLKAHVDGDEGSLRE
ncbi:hypothetical protein K504DRAFT_456950 [Pleomassaria siparia CBS 279.74]|uniref:Uncharacterized protein n=1 Tax=Pleomassaria siparia CBS 279.74 TaxID=1314801 RepID=A0A6G1KPJ4_9PLEO|nr:hypothetical protein K504DRAFT_456950 [Pleomassaria siparia CBS 279.74]